MSGIMTDIEHMCAPPHDGPLGDEPRRNLAGRRCQLRMPCRDDEARASRTTAADETLQTLADHGDSEHSASEFLDAGAAQRDEPIAAEPENER